MGNKKAMDGMEKAMTTLQRFFKNKKILVTGHTGFKGGWLTKILAGCGADVVGIGLKPKIRPNFYEALKLKNIAKSYICDVRKFDNVKKIFIKEKPEIVFHLAAQPLVRESYDAPLYTLETNIMGTANILEAIRLTKTTRAAVMITTDKVYKNKEADYFYQETDRLGGYDPYSGSKAAAEIVIDSYIKSYGMLAASARAGNVIGGGDWAKDRLTADVVRAVFEKNKKIIIRNPGAVRPWQYVLEPLYGYMLLAKNLYSGEKDFSGAWNFAPDRRSHIPVKDFLERVIKIIGKGSYVVKNDLSKHEAGLLKLNADKAKKYLKWRPALDIKEAIDWTFEWYKGFYQGEDVIKITENQIKSFFQKV